MFSFGHCPNEGGGEALARIKKHNIWAKLPKSGKLEKSKKSHNFLKLVAIVVDFFSHIVKFDFG